MKLKQTFLLASALLGGLALPQAQAQFPATITTGNQALLAGWDFDNILTFSNSAISRARYSDVWGNNSSSSALTTPGGIYYNGGVGSDTFGSSITKNSTGDINRDILTRTGSGSTFDLGGQTGGEGALDFSGAGVGGASLNEFSIQVNKGLLNGFTDIKLSLYGRDSGGLGGLTTINWSYSLDNGATKIGTGLSSVFTGAAFTNSTVDFFGTGLESINAALTSASTVVLVGEIVETGSARLNLDNIGVYGVATAIPEPSTYAAIIAALTLGVVALRRRKQVVVS